MDSVKLNGIFDRKSISIPLGGGWPGCALTAAIVAIRAFQPGTEPMSQWSFLSWALMTIPVLFPPCTRGLRSARFGFSCGL